MSLPSSTRPLRHGLNLSRFDDGMHPSACYDWLCSELNRPPEPYDLYHTGKMLYQNGRYKGASKMLQLYVDGNGNELPGHHLLGYAYAFLEEKRQAIQQLKKVANSGFDADWQLLIELQVDVDREAGLLPPPPPPTKAEIRDGAM